ncbi:MAG: dockerin type I repeat-containing protein [Candidatus Zixiibacteriota bacterium]
MRKKTERSFTRVVILAMAIALVASFAALTAYAADGEEPRMTSGPRSMKNATPAIDTEPIHNPAGSQMLVAGLTIVPTCDGYIDAAEWADAYMYDISDITGQHDGVPDPPGTVHLWLKQDDIGVYFAVRNNVDQTLDDWDEVGLYFDDNHDGCFSSSATTEGNEWLTYHPTGSTVQWRWAQDVDCGFPPDYVCYGDNFGGSYTWSPTCFGIGIGPTGVVDFEVMIPYGAVDEHLDLAMPPDSLGFFIYCSDGATGAFQGTWPSQGRADTWREPCYYGHLICETGEEWPDHKMHFPQLPDEIGWDVLATYPVCLADDWMCSQTGWVTDIHFWGSWKDLDGDPYTDDFATPAPYFGIGIYSNIPADVDTPWSRPGEQLWWWEGFIDGIPFDPPTLEAWYDPDTGSFFCNDHAAYWRYDFFLAQHPGADSFFQYEGQIYWLMITTADQPPFQWGWKTSRDHFMDDAVWGLDWFGPWFEMYEPPRCNWFDAAFITGTVSDYGSTNYYGDGWYYYPMYNWTNMWFYDNPFTYEREKHIWMDFYLEDFMGDAEFALNWSTPEWDEMGMGRPPLPEDGNEDLFIGREQFSLVYGQNTIDFWLPYNPEWVSIDFRGTFFFVNGWIWHECVGTSLDLAFVITGHEGAPPVICGDVNNDGIVNVGDIVYLVTYLYRAGPAPIPQSCVGDVNNDDIVNVGDIVYLVTYLYRAGPAPDPNCCNPPWKESQSNSTPHREHWFK